MGLKATLPLVSLPALPPKLCPGWMLAELLSVTGPIVPLPLIDGVAETAGGHRAARLHAVDLAPLRDRRRSGVGVGVRRG